MSVKILGGPLKGLDLKVCDSKTLRPTSVMLRRKIFDSHQNLEGFFFVDACAGTGAVGIEAFSRGAQKSYFFENNSQ